MEFIIFKIYIECGNIEEERELKLIGIELKILKFV